MNKSWDDLWDGASAHLIAVERLRAGQGEEALCVALQPLLAELGRAVSQPTTGSREQP